MTTRRRAWCVDTCLSVFGVLLTFALLVGVVLSLAEQM